VVQFLGMTEKNFLITFLVILVVGAGVFGLFTKFKEDTAGVAGLPSPGTEDALFGDQNSQTKTMKQYPKFPGVLLDTELQNKKAVIKTAKGNIEFEIYPEASKAASNFIFLVKDGFYNGLTFHRVEPGFVIQGGDPVGNGTGGPGYRFEDEPVTLNYDKGIVAMANAGPDTNGSQFFIMLEDNPTLPKNYTIFGKVISGQEVVDQITRGDVMQEVRIEANQ
jgi:cyclophilin family peptidyl-prolyl cis-trans isomerase